MKIICSDFVKRQVPGSAFSHSVKHSFEDIEKLTTEAYLKGNFKNGPRDGVFLVSLEPDGFVSGIVSLESANNILTKYSIRSTNEQPYLQICSDGKRLPAENVDIVIYSREALMEGNENSDMTADFEIVSINVATSGGVPMEPYTMARNQLALHGGTKAIYDSDAWVKSVYFWNNHSKAMPVKVRYKLIFNKYLPVVSGIALLIDILLRFFSI